MSDLPINQILDTVKWEPIEDAAERSGDLPVATHRGIVEIMGHTFHVFQLDDGTRVFDQQDVIDFFNGGSE